MRLQKSSITEIPYHLRAVRLRWAAFAVTLEEEEIEWVRSILASTNTPSHSRAMAQLLVCLHNREEISKLCLDLHVSRRKLLEFADLMGTKEGRRKLLSQPLPARGRPRNVV